MILRIVVGVVTLLPIAFVVTVLWVVPAVLRYRFALPAVPALLPFTLPLPCLLPSRFIPFVCVAVAAACRCCRYV